MCFSDELSMRLCLWLDLLRSALLVPQHGAEAHMVGAEPQLTRLSGARAVARAERRRAEPRAPLDHNRRALRTCKASSGSEIGAGRIMLGCAWMARHVPIPGVFPDIARHVEKAITIGLEAPHRCQSVEPVQYFVVSRKGTLPAIGPPAMSGIVVVVAPGEGGAVEAAARRELPFRFCRQVTPEPLRVSKRILVGELDDRAIIMAVDRAAWT